MTTRTPAVVAALMMVGDLAHLQRQRLEVVGARHVVLDVDADGAGGDDAQHDLRDRVGRRGVGVFDVRGHRHFHRAHDARDRLDHLARRHDAAVRIAERGGDAGARRRDGGESFGLEQPRAGGVPGIRQDENRRPVVKRAEPLSGIRHGASISSI